MAPLLASACLAAASGCEQRALPSNDSARQGAELFSENACATCHQEGAPGGNLRGVTQRRTREWFGEYLKNPAAVHPESMMPSYQLPARDVDALWAYLDWKDN